MLNVRDLMEILKTKPPDMPVAVSSDAEGNDFTLLSAASVARSHWHQIRMTNADREKVEKMKLVLILWPE